MKNSTIDLSQYEFSDDNARSYAEAMYFAENFDEYDQNAVRCGVDREEVILDYKDRKGV